LKSNYMSLEKLNDYITSLNDDFLIEKGNPLNEREINIIQRRIGFKFPRDYREFLKYFGTLYIEVSEKAWPRIEHGMEQKYYGHWITKYGIFAMGLGKNIPCILDVEKYYLDFQKKYQTEIKLLPLFKIVSISNYYYCMDESGTLYFFAFNEPWPKRIPDNYLLRLFQYIKELELNRDYLADNPNYCKIMFDQ
jgi:hypothetical protein